MKAQDRFISGREKAKTINAMCFAKWHQDGAAIELLSHDFIHGKGNPRLIISMSKGEALDLAVELIKEARK